MRLSLIVLALGWPAAAQVLDTQKILEQEQLAQVREAFDRGIYERAAAACEYEISSHAVLPGWHEMLARCRMAIGGTESALKACADGVKAHPQELSLLALQHEFLSVTGQADEAKAVLQAVNAAARQKPLKDRSAEDLVALGTAASAAGADPAKVISQYFVAAKKKDPKLEASYLAVAALALKHSDYKRAADELRLGLKQHGESPSLRFGLACAFAPSDRAESMKHIERVLETNARHEGALVLRAEHLISAERFDEAEESLTKATEINSGSPRAWALRSVIATLRDNDPAKASESRAKALEQWPRNPEVDHVIGACLSKAYRFAEGAQQQREVLALDPNYLPAKLQLAHDLMRLGDTDEAWKLAAEVREADGYNTQAHNLGLLEKEMAKYRSEQQNDFIFRMTDHDWQVYGPRALALLREAKAVLGPKYGHTFDKPTRVEFFPSQQDFAIRTFGALGGQGLLGVCFGTVITVNSPGSLAHGRNNWESTLWHEFCHVVTLSVTHNRMPRWLSEGISVYEEKQRDPAWGMRMDAKWRKMILEDSKLTPLGEMSSAFMKAESSDDMLFAYYESSAAVDWMIATHGWDKFRALLAELATGTRINDALAKHLAPMDQLEPAFADHMIALAKNYAPKADWTKPEGDDLAAYLKDHPTNLTALRAAADDALDAKQWDKALTIGQKLIDLEPEDTTGDSGYWIKGKALHQLNKLDEETQLLRTLAAKSADALPVFLRLIELDTKAQRWPELQQDAARAFSLNPFLQQPNEALAQAAEALHQNDAAIEHNERLLQLSPTNPAMIRFKLATLLKDKDGAKAKRHLLEALVLAPRFRDAQQLLLQMQPQ